MCKKERIKEVKQKIILSLLIFAIIVLAVTNKVYADDLLLDINDLIVLISKQTHASVGIYYSKSEFQPIIEEAADRHKLDPYLISAIIRVESNFNPWAVSYKGAQGLMQLMPETASEVGVTKPFDPYQNIMGGTYYYSLMLNRYGNHKQALYAYNCGPACVERGEIPRESKQYANNVIRVYKNLKEGRKKNEDNY